MNPVEIIAQKRDGQKLSEAQMEWFFRSYVKDEIPEYQMSALAMAIYFQGMDLEETTILTQQMLQSGKTLSWSSPEPAKVDKHSTGGVGDKISLILAPLLACCGLQVPMLSGRGLGSTGGTLDKLESIPGFRTNLEIAEIQQLTEQCGTVITGVTQDLVPADRKLYALRDVTATVPSIPLITASILSKKLSEGLSALVLDVKFGSGAFMKTLDSARALAESLVAVGTKLGVKISALITDMNQPLGNMVGNAVEVNESIEVLTDQGPADVRELVLELGAELLCLTAMVETRAQGQQMLLEKIESGAGLEKFQEMVAAQGGDLAADRPLAKTWELKADQAGFVNAIETATLGKIVVELGGGRFQLTDPIDHAVGLEMCVRLGDPVEVGQPLLRLFAHPQIAESALAKSREALTITESAPSPTPLIVKRLGSPF